MPHRCPCSSRPSAPHTGRGRLPHRPRGSRWSFRRAWSWSFLDGLRGRPLFGFLLFESVREVRHPGRVDNPRLFQLNGLCLDVVEQPHALAQQHWGEVDLHLVHEPGLEVLPDGVRTASDPDVFLARCRPSFLQGALDAVGDEGEGRPALPEPGFPEVVGEDEYGRAEGRRIRPAHLPLVEHPSTHHVGPDAGVQFLYYLIVLVGLSASEALELAPGFEVVDPPVYSCAPVAQIVVGPGVGPSNVPVQRHPHVHNNFAHFLSPSTAFLTFTSWCPDRGRQRDGTTCLERLPLRRPPPLVVVLPRTAVPCPSCARRRRCLWRPAARWRLESRGSGASPPRNCSRTLPAQVAGPAAEGARRPGPGYLQPRAHPRRHWRIRPRSGRGTAEATLPRALLPALSARRRGGSAGRLPRWHRRERHRAPGWSR